MPEVDRRGLRWLRPPPTPRPDQDRHGIPPAARLPLSVVGAGAVAVAAAAVATFVFGGEREPAREPEWDPDAKHRLPGAPGVWRTD